MYEYYLTKAEIIQLKSGLMSKSNKIDKSRNTNSSTKYDFNNSNYSSDLNPPNSNKEILKLIDSQFYKFINSEIGLDFKENIRNIFYRNYKWKDGIFSRHFFCRKITFNKKSKFVIIEQSIELKLKNKKIKFLLNTDNILYCITEKKTPK